MLEINRTYTKPELSQMLGTRSRQGIDRKLIRYGVGFEASGRGENAVYTIRLIRDPFKVFAITELGFDANTDFSKLRNFYYHFFEDDIFMAMPDEVKEARMREAGQDVSRLTIATYIARLEKNEMLTRHSNEFIYYFARGQKQRLVERDEYLKAWHEYWRDRDEGFDCYDAIARMVANYGGVARKQERPALNGIYNEKIEYMCSLIQQSLEKEIGA